jgi:hypothetical protein
MYFLVIASYVKSFTNKSVLILEETPNTVANLKIIASVSFFKKFSAEHLVVPYIDIGFNRDSSVHSI